jgi:hypothetical protein
VLATFEVEFDESTVSVNVTDEDSNPGPLVLPAESLKGMIMTRPTT